MLVFYITFRIDSTGGVPSFPVLRSFQAPSVSFPKKEMIPPLKNVIPMGITENINIFAVKPCVFKSGRG